MQQQAAATAATVGLHDRGVLAPGYRADINLIDLDRVGITTTEMLHDLPAGGKRLVQRADGLPGHHRGRRGHPRGRRRHRRPAGRPRAGARSL